MNKKIKINLAVFLLSVALVSCGEKIDPEVSTIYATGADRQTLRDEAMVRLYEHYQSSAKDKQYYEVVSTKKWADYIINYCPKEQLLSICDDQFSGWAAQYINIDEAKLDTFYKLKVPLDSFAVARQTFMKRIDSTLIVWGPRNPVKTNGHPTL